MPMNIPSILEHLIQEIEAGRHAALCVIVSTRGSTPQPAGTFVSVDETATVIGSLGGGCVEADIRRQAHGLLRSGESQLATFTLDDDFGDQNGMICGGQMDVAIKIFSSLSEINLLRKVLDDLSNGQDSTLPIVIQHQGKDVEYRIRIDSSPNVLIAGAGHISRILAQFLVPLGFRVTVIDERVDFTNEKRFPKPIQTIAADIAGTLRDYSLDRGTYVVIVTRGHRHDLVALKAVIDSPCKYIGMIGSRRKIAVIFDDLLHAGVPQSKLDGVQAPIGIDIHSVTTEEIALSIAAQLVSVRREAHHKSVEGPLPT